MRCKAGEMAFVTKKTGLTFTDPGTGLTTPELVKVGTVVKLKRLRPEIHEEMWELETPIRIWYQFPNGSYIDQDVLGICDRFLTPIRPGPIEDDLPSTTDKPLKETA